MENLIKILGVISWPVTVIIIIFLFRKQLKCLLPFVENVKYKDFEVKFRKELEQIREEAQDAGIEIQKQLDKTTEIYKLAEHSPDSAILQAWKNLENAALKKVKELASHEANLKILLKHPLSYLENTGAIRPSPARTIRELRSLRNRMIHSNEIKVTKETAMEYISLSVAIIKQVEAISELPKIKLSALTYLILELNHLIDSNNYTHITINDIHKEIEKKQVIPFLTELARNDIDLSLYGEEGPYVGFVDFYHEQLFDIHACYVGDERRKWGIENQGLCLLLAWTNEIIQRGTGWYPFDN